MIDLKRWYLDCYYKFYYRKVDQDVCCCGSSNCDGDYTHSYVNAKDYAIEQAVNYKLSNPMIDYKKLLYLDISTPVATVCICVCGFSVYFLVG